MSPRLDDRDLAHVLDHARDAWGDLRGAHVLITGATGFVGSWLLETLVHANDALHLGVHVTALVRAREAFAERLPHLAASPVVELRTGDVRSVVPPPRAFSHYVHCASAATPEMNARRPDDVVEIIERGTAHMLEEAASGRGARFLQISSGSVYGRQPPGLERMDESYRGTADALDSAQRFGAAKRRAELYGEAAVARGVAFVSARVFALVGPRLPLDGQFAIGNFIGDALAARPIRLTGDGTPVRSWMHAADMAAWCWTLLVRGRAGAAYNVGSETPVSMWNAARLVAALPVTPVTVERARAPEPGAAPSRYVPSTRRAREELALEAWIPFDDALRRAWTWLQHGKDTSE
jgi:dTDP-glucose 4,6-dehydratase